MSKNQLVVLGTYNNTEILARTSVNFVDVTQMCQANGKEWYDYVKTVGATRFREAPSARPTNRRSGNNDDDDGLVVTTRDEGGHQGHTVFD
jgi:hypothetical protein